MAESSVRIADQASGNYFGAGLMRSVDAGAHPILAQFVRMTAKPVVWGLSRSSVSTADSADLSTLSLTGLTIDIGDETACHIVVIPGPLAGFTSAVITPVLMDNADFMAVLDPITVSKPATPLTLDGTDGLIYGGKIDVAGFSKLFLHVTAVTSSASFHIRHALV